MIGQTLSHYKIIEKLGQGGMGEVYLAEDSRLKRKVALKILPQHLSEKAELRKRFEREARAVSSLNHPHICTLYDIGEQHGIHFLVMEHLEGQTLSARLEKGALPLEQTLEYAIQIADALDKAHRQGVVHRDLKPGNIMLTKSGAKLLDFGLAKLQAADTPTNLSALPTEQASLTAEGTILGTLQYMAPEQLEGKEADNRTDIFAFGAVVYEMATGKKAFEGKSQASLIGAILKDDPPPMSELQPMTPAVLGWVVKRCLAKEPDERVQTAADLLAELKWVVAGGSQPDVQAPVVLRRQNRERLAWTATTVILGLAMLGLAARMFLSRVPAEERPVSFFVFAPETTTFTPTEAVGAPHLAVSPDGQRLAFVAATAGGQPLVWVRPLDSVDAQALPGTEGASFPFWSPDSRSIGFFAEGKLKRVEVSGGLPQTLCDALQGRGGSWNHDGVIVFAPNINDPLHRVSAAGGVPVPVTTLDDSRQETSHRWPSFLPDGRHFTYFARSADRQNSAIMAGSLDLTGATLLVSAEEGAGYAPPGYLLFVHAGALVAQPFSLNDLELTGEPLPIVEEVSRSPDFNYVAFSVSETGVLAYGRDTITPKTELTWFDRTGRRVGRVGPAGEYSDPWLSPNERLVAVARLDRQTGTRDIWLYETSTGTASQFTFNPSDESKPLWSPDGRVVAFRSNRDGHGSIYQKVSSGAGNDEALFKSSTGATATDWSLDGQSLVFQSPGPSTGWDLWVFRVGDQQATPLLQTGFNEMHGRLSPDGRWLAYSSDEMGRREVYVQPFPASGGKWRISSSGGTEPHWGRDGEELFYLAADRQLMAVPVKGGASTFQHGVPSPLFEARPATITAPFGSNYVVAADGNRFLINTVVEGVTSPPITVVTNWTKELEQ